MLDYSGRLSIRCCLIKNKTITIAAGEKVGLVGFSGSGKSTFVNLILRLFEVESGSILIDKKNINEVTQASLRENIALIPQENVADAGLRILARPSSLRLKIKLVSKVDKWIRHRLSFAKDRLGLQ